MTWSAFLRIYPWHGYLTIFCCFVPDETSLDVINRGILRLARIDLPRMVAENDPRLPTVEKNIMIAEAILDDPSRGDYFGGLAKRLQLHFVALELESIMNERDAEALSRLLSTRLLSTMPERA